LDNVELRRALRHSFLFEPAGDAELDDIVAKATFRRYAAGEYIFWEGDRPDRFFLLTEGRVKVVKHGNAGRETVVAFFQPGEVFGEVAVLENKPYPASCVVVKDCTVMVLDRVEFQSFIKSHPALALALVGILSARLREAQSRLHDLAGERVDQRLARTLERLTDKLGPELPFTRQDLADMSGTTLETTVRFLSRLKEGGIISSKRGQVTIEDLDRLRLLAEGPPGTG
jgi:CRP/FNR family transcriptional regulator